MPTLANLPAKDADRLAKLAGMLGSTHEGEIVNAARAATGLLERHGLTWRDALTPILPRTVPPIPVTPMRSHMQRAAFCLAYGAGVLTDWERGFCRSLADRRTISPKQSDMLAEIAAKVERQAARAGAYA